MSAQISWAFVSPAAIEAQIEAQYGMHGSQASPQAAPHAPPAPALTRPLTASSQMEQTEPDSTVVQLLRAQFEIEERETQLELADDDAHGEADEPTEWHVLSISHQSHCFSTQLLQSVSAWQPRGCVATSGEKANELRRRAGGAWVSPSRSPWGRG